MSYTSEQQTVGGKGNENHPKLKKFNLNIVLTCNLGKCLVFWMGDHLKYWLLMVGGYCK